MFSFFKKEKKKKSPIPPYDSKLIRKFHKDHEKLVTQIGIIKKNIETNKVEKAKEGLKKLKMSILGHCMEEDIKLYWYLKDYYKKNDSVMEIILMYGESIKKVQKTAMSFLDKYSGEHTPLDAVFNKQFDEIIDVLATRIETEENNLYTLYIK